MKCPKCKKRYIGYLVHKDGITMCLECQEKHDKEKAKLRK